MNTDFWNGRRVWVTGHTGFKGAWLALLLERLGARVGGLALTPPTQPNLFDLTGLADTIEASTIGDIRDLDIVAATMTGFEPEIVIHMAAQSLVRASYEAPVDTYATNVMGTVNVLESVRGTPSVRAVVVVTSDKCYENHEGTTAYTEDQPMGGHDPYSSKGCAELVTAAYRRSFLSTASGTMVGVATARAGNVIGGGDFAQDRLVPDLVRAFRAGRIAELRAPNSIRPWQHVLEPLSGYLTLAQRLIDPSASCDEAWNFGPAAEDAWSVARVADRLAELWGDSASWVQGPEAVLHEAISLRLDCTKATQRLGWRPVWGLEEALGATVEWHRAVDAGITPRDITREQINRWISNADRP